MSIVTHNASSKRRSVTDANTLYLFSGISLEGMTDGDPINSWEDLSSLGNDAYKSENATSPVKATQDGLACSYHDGNTVNAKVLTVDYLSQYWIGTDNMTWECHVKLLSSPPTSQYPVYIVDTINSNNWHSLFHRINSATLSRYMARWNYNGSNIAYPAINNTISGIEFGTGDWYHIAQVRNGTTFKVYVNGTEISSNTVSESAIYPHGGIGIGGVYAASTGNVIASQCLKGYLDRVKFSNVARYTSSGFTPPDRDDL
jgi:hypothetical protein